MIVVPLVVVAGLLAASCEGTDTADPTPTTDAAFVDAFAAVTVPPSIVPADQVTSCVDATKYGAFVGDVDASARWNAVGQSDDALTEACTQIGRDDPDALATMHWNWTASQAAVAVAPPAPVAAPANDCDPSYPTLCIPLGSPDLNCPDISDRDFPVQGPDPHGFDRNQDGIGCES